MIQNINASYGDAISFETVDEMAEAIRACGYVLPVDGLKEGRDYAEAPAYCTQNGGDCATCSLVSYGRDCMNNSIASR
ncbi:MAG: hypothetical protein WC683_18605 [bacterium]